MTTIELFERLSVALAVGLLIGLERGWQARSDAEGERAAGLRTFALLGLLGGIWGALTRDMPGGPVALALAFAVTGGAITAFRWRETEAEHTKGATTVVAALLAFAIGALAVHGDRQVAAASGVAVALLLSLKATLHGWLRRISWPELRSALVLLAMTFILLPLLPNRAVDPWGAVNPFELWLMTIMIAVISFAGYIAIRLVGDRAGIALTAVAGGLASSTAVTLTFARLAREHPGEIGALSAGAALSGATMMARVLAVVAVVNPALLVRLAILLVPAGLVLATAATALLVRRDAGPSRTAIRIDNPFDLPTVLKFGALLVAVSLVARTATGAAGDAGAYAVAALSGIADVDAITLSMSRLGGGPLSNSAAATAIALAVGVNTLAKAALAALAGGRAFGLRLAAISAGAVAAALVARAAAALLA